MKKSSINPPTLGFLDHLNRPLFSHFMYSMHSVWNKVRMINDYLKRVILWDVL